MTPAALSDAQPEGIRYASYLLPNGETFVALTQLDASLRSLYAEDLRRAFSPERDVELAGWHEMCDSDRPGSYGGSVLARSPQKNGVFASLNTRGCATPPTPFSLFPF